MSVIDIPIVKKIIEDFEGKEIYCCHTSGIDGRRVNFDMQYVSFCHEGEITNTPQILKGFCRVEEFTVEKYYETVYELLLAFQDAEYPCRKCSHCAKETFHFKPISLVIVCPSGYCNSSCIYCYAHFTPNIGGYNPIPHIQQLIEQGCLKKDCFFDWGGGEPTQGAYFEDTVKYIAQHKYRQRINTNAIEFSKQTYLALKKNIANVRVSIDSGTEDGFRIMKGHDKCNQVWENIGRYCSVSNDVNIKYNICNYNSDVPELEAFLDKCHQYDVKNIHIDGEYNSYQKEKNAGPFYYTQKEFEAAKYLEKRATEDGFRVTISGYAFGSRPVYKNGRLALPETYFDNMDHAVLQSGIYLKTFSNLTYLFSEINRMGGTV